MIRHWTEDWRYEVLGSVLGLVLDRVEIWNGWPVLLFYDPDNLARDHVAILACTDLDSVTFERA